MDEGRVNFAWISASEGGRFAELIDEVTKKVKKLGPNQGFIGGRMDQVEKYVVGVPGICQEIPSESGCSCRCKK